MGETKQYHPITADVATIIRNGLMVFDNIDHMPTSNDSFATDFMTIGLNLRGWVKAECDMRPVCFKQHDVAVVSPRHIICPIETSQDYLAMLIVMSPKFQEAIKKRYPNIYSDNFHYIHRQDVPLSPSQFETVLMMFRLIHKVSIGNDSNRWEILGDLLDALFLMLRNYRKENGIEEHVYSPHEQLFAQFYEAITLHFKESREVRFYADLFHLTPKHFATIIKKHTNINALEWINSYASTQARQFLRYQQQMSVQEIALELGFNDQASFSRFFKNQMGMSPLDYRKQAF